MSESKLPADPLALILGIAAILIGVFGCCLTYGLTSVVPLVISIVGIVISNKSLKAYKEKPEAYSDASRSNVSVGKIINIISVVFNGIIILILLIGLLFFGTFFYKMFDNLDKEGVFDQKYPYEIEATDSIYDDPYEIEVQEIEKDTLMIDSTMIEEIKETEIIEN